MVEKNELTESDFLNSIIYFGAIKWCQPCKLLHPMFESMSKKYPSLNFIYVDADNSPDVVSSFKISSVPTVKLFINGEEKRTFVGLNSTSIYENEIKLYTGDV